MTDPNQPRPEGHFSMAPSDHALLRLLSQRTELAFLVIDRAGSLTYVSRCMARLLGGEAQDFAGVPVGPWFQRPEQLDERLAKVQAKRVSERLLISAARSRHTVLLDLSAWNDLVLGVALAVVHADGGVEGSFELPASASEVRAALGAEEGVASGDLALLRNEKTPFEDPPAAQSAARGEIVAVWASTGERGYPIMRGRRIDADSSQVRLLSIDDRTLSALIQARIARLAKNSGLSQRERQVLELLLIGRGSADIAALLGISARTVKFHQANLLGKLGAESRADLVRLLLM